MTRLARPKLVFAMLPVPRHRRQLAWVAWCAAVVWVVGCVAGVMLLRSTGGRAADASTFEAHRSTSEAADEEDTGDPASDDDDDDDDDDDETATANASIAPAILSPRQQNSRPELIAQLGPESPFLSLEEDPPRHSR